MWFQILQELQETLGLEVLTETTKKAKKETENIMSKTKNTSKTKYNNNAGAEEHLFLP